MPRQRAGAAGAGGAPRWVSEATDPVSFFPCTSSVTTKSWKQPRLPSQLEVMPFTVGAPSPRSRAPSPTQTDTQDTPLEVWTPPCPALSSGCSHFCPMKRPSLQQLWISPSDRNPSHSVELGGRPGSTGRLYNRAFPSSSPPAPLACPGVKDHLQVIYLITRKGQPTAVFLPGEFPGQRRLAGYRVHGVAKSRS